MNNNLVSAEDKWLFYKAFINEHLYLVNEPEGSPAYPAAKNEEITEEPIHELLSLTGNKRAETLLLFNYGKAATIPENDKIFVNQVLKAVNLNFDEVAWLNVAHDPGFSWEALLEVCRAKNIIAFGLEEFMLPAKIAEGEIHIYNSRKILCAGQLSEISMNKSQKKLLWDGLKQLYGI